MPILDIQIVGPVPGSVRADLARRLAEAVGDALAAPPGSTWIRVHDIPEADYAENGGGDPGDALPVFVALLLADPPEGEARAAQIERLTPAIAAACGRPADRVHLLYEPPGRGRMAFGGRLRS